MHIVLTIVLFIVFFFSNVLCFFLLSISLVVNLPHLHLLKMSQPTLSASIATHDDRSSLLLGDSQDSFPMDSGIISISSSLNFL